VLSDSCVRSGGEKREAGYGEKEARVSVLKEASLPVIGKRERQDYLASKFRSLVESGTGKTYRWQREKGKRELQIEIKSRNARYAAAQIPRRGGRSVMTGNN